MAERRGAFEATLELDKREESPLLVLIHLWEKACGEGWHYNTFMIESVPFVGNQSLLFFKGKKKHMGKDEMEMFSLKCSSQHTKYNLINFLMYTFKCGRGVSEMSCPLQGKVAWRTPWCANVEAEPAIEAKEVSPLVSLVLVESGLQEM